MKLYSGIDIHLQLANVWQSEFALIRDWYK